MLLEVGRLPVVLILWPLCFHLIEAIYYDHQDIRIDARRKAQTPVNEPIMVLCTVVLLELLCPPHLLLVAGAFHGKFLLQVKAGIAFLMLRLLSECHDV